MDGLLIPVRLCPPYVMTTSWSILVITHVISLVGRVQIFGMLGNRDFQYSGAPYRYIRDGNFVHEIE